MTPAEVSEAYLAAVLHGDRRRAFRAVDDARASGLDTRTMYLDIFQPALREIGALWQRNEISVAVEHLATGITEACMARIYQQDVATGAAATRSLLAACAETERHVIGLRMVCDLLELDGWQTTFLGASVPLESLADMADELRPDAIALSASIAPHVPQLRDAIRALHARMHAATPVIAVGGRPFMEDPSLAQKIGADLTATDAAELVQRLKERVP